MLTIRAMSDGKGYSSRHLEHSDYYAEGERVTGVWQGRGAELLGLRGTVMTEEFEALRQGLDPGTNEFLRVRRSAERKAVDGTKLAQGRSLYDFTISAPKSVSILAIIEGDDRLIEAHRKAVNETLHEIETYAASRVRQARANEDRPTGNLALAVYHHDTSRELDPQLHTHAVAANLTYDGTEGRSRRSKRRRSTRAAPIFPRFTATHLLAKFELWAMRSKASGTRRATMPGSRSVAFPRTYSRSSASEASSVIRRSRTSWRNTAGVPRTTRSQCWFGNRGRTNRRDLDA